MSWRIWKSYRGVLPLWLVVTLAVVSLAVVAFVVAAAVVNARDSPDSFYVLPRSGGDWGAWAGWFAALGTIAALVFAGSQFMADQQEKKEERRNRRLDLVRAIRSGINFKVSSHHPEYYVTENGYAKVDTSETTGFDASVTVSLPGGIDNVLLKTNFTDYQVIRTMVLVDHEDDYESVFPGSPPNRIPNWKNGEVSIVKLREDLWQMGPLEEGQGVRVAFSFNKSNELMWFSADYHHEGDEFDSRDPRVTMYFRDSTDRLWSLDAFKGKELAYIPIEGVRELF